MNEQEPMSSHYETQGPSQLPMVEQNKRPLGEHEQRILDILDEVKAGGDPYAALHRIAAAHMAESYGHDSRILLTSPGPYGAYFREDKGVTRTGKEAQEFMDASAARLKQQEQPVSEGVVPVAERPVIAAKQRESVPYHIEYDDNGNRVNEPSVQASEVDTPIVEQGDQEPVAVLQPVEIEQTKTSPERFYANSQEAIASLGELRDLVRGSEFGNQLDQAVAQLEASSGLPPDNFVDYMEQMQSFDRALRAVNRESVDEVTVDAAQLGRTSDRLYNSYRAMKSDANEFWADTTADTQGQSKALIFGRMGEAAQKLFKLQSAVETRVADLDIENEKSSKDEVDRTSEQEQKPSEAEENADPQEVEAVQVEESAVKELGGTDVPVVVPLEQRDSVPTPQTPEGNVDDDLVHRLRQIDQGAGEVVETNTSKTDHESTGVTKGSANAGVVQAGTSSESVMAELKGSSGEVKEAESRVDAVQTEPVPALEPEPALAEAAQAEEAESGVEAVVTPEQSDEILESFSRINANRDRIRHIIEVSNSERIISLKPGAAERFNDDFDTQNVVDEAGVVDLNRLMAEVDRVWNNDALMQFNFHGEHAPNYASQAAAALAEACDESMTSAIELMKSLSFTSGAEREYFYGAAEVYIKNRERVVNWADGVAHAYRELAEAQENSDAVYRRYGGDY